MLNEIREHSGETPYNVCTKDTWRQLCISCLVLFHFVFSIGLFAVAWMFFSYGKEVNGLCWGWRDSIFLLIYSLVLHLINQTYSAHLLGYNHPTRLVLVEFLAQMITILVIYVASTVLFWKIKTPIPYIILLIVQLCFDFCWAYEATKLYIVLYPLRRGVLVYRNEIDKQRLKKLWDVPIGKLFEVDHEIRYDGGGFSSIRNQLHGFDAVFVAGVDHECENSLIKYCKEEGTIGFLLPHIGNIILRSATHVPSFPLPVLYMGKDTMHPFYRFAKRMFDFVFALIGILCLWPLILIVAAVIHLYDGGPAFYRQTRLTRGGRKFKIWKFRSMRTDAEKDGLVRLSTGENDSRITPIGRIVRKCRLDEIPQLFNILIGDMSFVGPRPERPEIAEQYYDSLPEFRLRLQVKAGLTGYAQVYGKYNTDPYEKLEFDLMYINNMSFLTDLKLILATLPILFISESTEGVDVNNITAFIANNSSR